MRNSNKTATHKKNNQKDEVTDTLMHQQSVVIERNNDAEEYANNIMLSMSVNELNELKQILDSDNDSNEYPDVIDDWLCVLCHTTNRFTQVVCKKFHKSRFAVNTQSLNTKILLSQHKKLNTSTISEVLHVINNDKTR
eukprot:244984_1